MKKVRFSVSGYDHIETKIRAQRIVMIITT
jgi:hypothetical protein